MMPIRVAVNDGSQVSEARRVASDFAKRLGLADEKLGNLALVVTEAATNLIKHTPHGGELLVQALPQGDARGVEIIAVDNGPGIANPGEALGDGYSTAVGSAGTGLGAIQRQSDSFDLYSSPGRGTALLVRFWSADRREVVPGRLEAGAVRVPNDGEIVCGDDWAVAERDGRSLMLVVDGLGHGSLASEAAAKAVEAFRQNLRLGPAELMSAVHAALRKTRGGVAAVAEVSANRETFSFVGVGNISGVLYQDDGRRSMVSQPGTVGQEARKIQRFDYPWSSDATLVLYSDGLASRLDLRSHPGLASRNPTLIAAVLYKAYKRGHDDAVVLVAREARR